MASIWQRPFSLETLTAIHVGTAVDHLGIEFLEVGDDFIRARAPVDSRTRQPYGILHGGVSVVLAETVGLDINANHLRGVSSGWVTGTARSVHRGRTTHVWQIELRDEAGNMSCISRITMAILAPAG